MVKDLESRPETFYYVIYLGECYIRATVTSGTGKSLNPPRIVGLTMEKIITSAWAVTATSQVRSSPGSLGSA